MSQLARLIFLNNALLDTQKTVNKIIVSGFAGHTKELENNLAKIMCTMCVFDTQSEISIEAVNEKTDNIVSDVLNEISFKFHNTDDNPESIRKTFKVVE